MAARLGGYAGERAVLFASVVEFIHTATLVHDDIIDDAECRRGQPAVHSRWGNDVTVLLGDYLYIKSMALALSRGLARHPPPAVRRDAAHDRGRALPAHEERRCATSPRTSTSTSSGARPPICSAGCAQIGGMLGGIDADQQTGAARVRLQSGHGVPARRRPARSHRDEAALGKPVGGDLREGKLTLPVIHLLQRAEGGAQQTRRGRRARAQPDAGAVAAICGPARRAQRHRLRAAQGAAVRRAGQEPPGQSSRRAPSATR